MIYGEKIRNAETIKQKIKQTISQEIRQKIRSKIETIPDIKIDYIAVADPETLHELTTINSNAVILIAVRIGTTRLIDNVLITTTPS
jgi:pantoate--beta-alanine ligase